MEEANAMAQHQMMLQQQQQQQLMLLHQQYQQQQQAAAISRFPSNIDAHLRTPGLLRQPIHNLHPHQQQQSPQQQHQQQSQQQQHQQQSQQQQHQQQQKAQLSRPGSQAEIEMAQQDAWRVCHPNVKRPFSTLEDACERLLPYHVLADYEAEEDDKLLEADPTGQMLTRSQQWDHNIAVKIAEFTATFEKQVLAFNILTRKRAQGEIRLEERLMMEQALLQDEKQAYMAVRAEIESREKAGREAAVRMAMVQAEQARVEAQTRAEMMARGGATGSEPVRGGASSQGNVEENISGEMPAQEQAVHMDEILHGWGNVQREDEEPPEDFLNDEHEQNSENGVQEEWREAGELDLNMR